MREGKGREGKGGEGKGREGKGREGKGRGEGREGQQAKYNFGVERSSFELGVEGKLYSPSCSIINQQSKEGIQQRYQRKSPSPSP